MSNIYTEQLTWAKKRGLYIDSRLERKCVDGIWGFFAKGSIEPGVKLVSYPIDKAIKNVTTFQYPQGTSDLVKNVHAALLEFDKGQQSEFYGHFLQLESLEYLQKHSTFFYSDDDIKLLESMNYFLAKAVVEHKQESLKRISEIQALVPTINPDTVVIIYLNYLSRAWGDANFLPIIDYANHSDRLGKQRQCKNGEYFIESKYAYQKGDQVYLSYGRKDMYLHAILYNYFDPEGAHFIHYGSRFVQLASTPFELEVLKYTASKFKLVSQKHNNQYHYSCLDLNVGFLETAPTLNMIEYIQSNYFVTTQDWKNKKSSQAALAQRLLDVLNIMINANKVKDFKLDDIPTKMHHFYSLLKKENVMLQQNKNWVVDNFYL